MASADFAHMTPFEEGLGRIMCVAGALEYERPFLGPLYKFLMLHPYVDPQGSSVREVHTRLFVAAHTGNPPQLLRYRDKIDENSNESGCAGQRGEDRNPVLDEQGNPSVGCSSWFSLEITESD